MSETRSKKSYDLPSTERVQEGLAKAESMDDFFGRDGIFARLFANTMEQMLEAELSDHLGYDRYEAKGRNSGNSRNGHYGKKVRSSSGDVKIQVPRDRDGSFEPKIVPKYGSNTNELEEKILGMYARGISTRDIQDALAEMYGVDVSPSLISKVTDKVWETVEAWQNRPLDAIYPIIYLDALHLKIRQDGKVVNTAVYAVLAVDLNGHRDVLGHWVSDGAEGANFWLSVITDLQNRGVQDIFIACMDGLTGFSDAVHAVFPKTETQLLHLGEKWNDKYAMAVRSWENNWDELSTFFNYPTEIRRLIYTNNTIEGYNRQLRKVTKTKSVFPTHQAVRKLLYLVNVNITKKWTRPLVDWPLILNQLAIRFQDRFPA